MNTEENILNFINKFKHVKYEFLNGKCFWFSYILKTLFSGQIYYSQIDNHFICNIDDKYYDASGEVSINRYKDLTYFDEYRKSDPFDSYRIFRDCILFDDNITQEPLSDSIIFYNKIFGGK